MTENQDNVVWTPSLGVMERPYFFMSFFFHQSCQNLLVVFVFLKNYLLIWFNFCIVCIFDNPLISIPIFIFLLHYVFLGKGILFLFSHLKVNGWLIKHDENGLNNIRHFCPGLYNVKKALPSFASLFGH